MFEIFLLLPHASQAVQELGESIDKGTGNALCDLVYFLLKELHNKLSKENSLQVDKYFCTYGIVFSLRHLLGKVNFR